MSKKQLIIPFLLIPVITLFILYGTLSHIDAESDETNNVGFIDVKNKSISCKSGFELNDKKTVCIPICPEGTEYFLGDSIQLPRCEHPTYEGWNETQWLGAGVILAALATAAGIGLTLTERKKESDKRTQELIKTYADEIREITNKETTLQTKQDCALYAEQYLDTLEQIATLRAQKIFSDNAIKYFDNNFAFGRDLWWWYHKFIHGFEDEMQDKIWKATEDSKSERFSISYLYPELTEHSKLVEKSKSLENFLNDDRWPEFRKLCAVKPITFFENEYTGIEGYPADVWRVLPDIMYYDYDDIPDENGLTKAELVDIIRPFANDLSDFVEKEKQMETLEEFEVYAEQYLENLEQIATLFRNNIIPKKAKEYFENKFSYGCNLWEWYHQKVLKFSPGLVKAIWNTDTPKTKLSDIFSKEKLATLKKDQKEKAEEQLKKDLVQKSTLTSFKKNYPEDINNLIHEDSDVWRLVKLYSQNLDEQTKAKAINFLKYNEDKISSAKNKAYGLGQKLIALRQAKKPLTEIEETAKQLKKAEDELRDKINQLLRPDFLDNATLDSLFKEFVYNFLVNERWKDFRWWCQTEGITPFQEDPTEGLILPLKMWQAQYK